MAKPKKLDEISKRAEAALTSSAPKRPTATSSQNAPAVKPMTKPASSSTTADEDPNAELRASLAKGKPTTKNQEVKNDGGFHWLNPESWFR